MQSGPSPDFYEVIAKMNQDDDVWRALAICTTIFGGEMKF